MINALADKIWKNAFSTIRNYAPSAYNGKSKNKSGDQDSEISLPLISYKFDVSLWIVVGEEAHELFSKAELHIENQDYFVLQNTTKDDNQNSNIKFSFENISNFRRHEIDMFQWAYRSKNSMDEYGVLCQSNEDADTLSRLILNLLINKSEELLVVNASLYRYDRLKNEWASQNDNILFKLFQRSSDLEGYAAIFTCEKSTEKVVNEKSFNKLLDDSFIENRDKIIQKKENMGHDGNCHSSDMDKLSVMFAENINLVDENINNSQKNYSNSLFQVTLSNENRIFPCIQEHMVVWWLCDGFFVNNDSKDETLVNSESNEDASNSKTDLCASTRYSNQMIAAKFSDEETTKKVINMIEIILLENRNSKRLIRKNSNECDQIYFDDSDKIYHSFGYNNDEFSMDIEDSENEKIDWNEDEESEELRINFSHNDCANSNNNLDYKFMQVGTNRTYVVMAKNSLNSRKTEIHTISFDADGSQTITDVMAEDKFIYNRESLIPIKAILHSGETKMIFIEENDREKVYMMDLERQRVVNCWGSNHLRINNILPSNSEYGLSDGNSTFLGINSQSVFYMDPRLRDQARTHTLSYSSKVNLCSAATNSYGHILAGSRDGSFRFFDGTTNYDGKIKKAKNHLIGLGDPILHSRISRNGDWILGTCEKYLVLYPVKLKSKNKTPFTVSLGRKKPRPLILRLKLDDIIKYKLQNMKFTQANFNLDETAIITAIENHIVMWNLTEIKKGNNDCYSIRPMEDHINDVAFLKKGNVDTVVLATPSSFRARTLKRLKN